jgi:hypothetical protein
MAELMVSANNFTTPYTRALLATTPRALLLDPDGDKALETVRPEDLARMERDMQVLEKKHREVREKYGEHLLVLVVGVRYLSRLLDNARVVRHLSTHYPEYLAEFQKMVEATGLEGLWESYLRRFMVSFRREQV